jgi:hypothetical protein
MGKGQNNTLMGEKKEEYNRRLANLVITQNQILGTGQRRRRRRRRRRKVRSHSRPWLKKTPNKEAKKQTPSIFSNNDNLFLSKTQKRFQKKRTLDSDRLGSARLGNHQTTRLLVTVGACLVCLRGSRYPAHPVRMIKSWFGAVGRKKTSRC